MLALEVLFISSQNSCFVLNTLSSPSSFLLPQAHCDIWQELSSLLLPAYNGSLYTHFFLLMTCDLAKHGVLICLLQSHVVSFILPLVSTLLFPRTGGILFYLNLLTHMSLECFHGETCTPSSQLLCSILSSLQYSLWLNSISLKLAESKILHAASAVI